ncbi:MAG: efflux RND transporter periplasmic adaptor subunit [Candidatus Eremiobacterota bacterium]
MNRWSLLIGTILLVLGLALGWTLRSPGPSPGGSHQEEHGEEHSNEHEEGRVHLTPDQQKDAGVEVAAVQAGQVSTHSEATGTLAPDPDRQIRVGSRVAGRVRRLYARVGDPVAGGDPLAEIDSPELADARASYHNSLVEAELARKNLTRVTRLARVGDEALRDLEETRNEVAMAESELKSAEAELELVQRRSKRVEELFGDGIASGQQREEARAELRQAEARRAQARTALDVARRHRQRESLVLREGLRTSGPVWEAEAALARAEEDLHHRREFLELLGADPDSHHTYVVLEAPRSGVVVERPVSEGESVTAETELYTLLDTARLWLWVQVPEADVQALGGVSRVRLTVSAYPGRVFAGRLTFVDPVVDEHTRSVKARVEVENPDGRLKPNMFASAQLLGPPSEQGVLVPAEALQRVEGQDVVYVAVASDEFERRPVRLGGRQGDRAEVLEGLQPGDRVVVRGAFSVRSVDQKEAMGEGHHH